MKRIFLCLCFAMFLFSCNNSKTEVASATTDTTAKMAMTDMPYTVTYSSNFTDNVSDADLKMVLMTYKDWANGNISNLSNSMGDSVYVEFNTGDKFNGTKADLMKIWSKTRDSLSSVTIEMEAWKKMYEPNKKDAAILTWYKEIDTYKTGKVDSGYYHDINGIKNGKISNYSQYKRPAK
jgi:PBP1b-binding outer membrane lipoprotein LpoB